MSFQSSMALRNQGVTILGGTFVIPYSPYTNDDDNNGNKPSNFE